MALMTGSDIKQTRKNIAVARAELSGAVQALTERLNVKTRVAHSAKERTQQAARFGKQNQTAVIVATVCMLAVVVGFIARRRSR